MAEPLSTLGVSLLASGGAYAHWAALNPSPFTLQEWAAKEPRKAETARRWVLVAIGSGLLGALAIALVFPGPTGLVAALSYVLTIAGLAWAAFSALRDGRPKNGRVRV